MSNDRADNKLQTMADRLRGKIGQEAQQVGKELSRQGVGKVKNVQEIAPPKDTPKMEKNQGDAGWQRQLSEEQKHALAAKSLGKTQAAMQKTISQPEHNPVMGADGVVKNKNLAELAQGLRGVSGGKAVKDIETPKQTPEVEKKQARGRGR